VIEGPRHRPWLTTAADWKTRFPEMVAEEARKGYFRIFETREPAVEWLEELGDEAGGG
jgi:hypothetical protein